MDEKTASEGTHTHEHAPGCFFCLTVKPMARRFWTEATEHHFRNARVEFLKGVRSLVDERISKLSNVDPRGTHVTVE